MDSQGEQLHFPLDKGSLRSLIIGPLNRGEEECLLNDVVNLNGWNQQGFSFTFPQELRQIIKGTPTSYFPRCIDHNTWSSSSSGNFELKEAYKLAKVMEEGDSVEGFNGEWIWKVLTIPKIKCFLWQCYHKSISVRTALAARGMDVSPLCPVCNEAPRIHYPYPQRLSICSNLLELLFSHVSTQPLP